VAGITIVLVLHLSCFTNNISASEFPLSAEETSNSDLSELVPPDDNVFTTVPSVLGQDEVNDTNSPPDVPLNPEGEPIIKKLSASEFLVDVDGELTIEKLTPQAAVNLSELIDSYEQSQTEVTYDVNDPTNTERPDSEVSYDVKSETTTKTTQPAESSTKGKEVAENPWIQRIRNSKSRSLELSRPMNTTKISSVKPLLLGQIISNVLYGDPWLAPQTNLKCAEDMRLYNIHMQNLTMWAFRSK